MHYAYTMLKIWTKSIHAFLFISLIWSNPVFCAKYHKNSSTRVVLQHVSGLCVLYSSNMMMSSNGNIFRVTGHLCGEFTGPRWIPHIKASDAELWCFFYLRLNKRLSKQSWGWWFETLPAHYDVTVMLSIANNCVSNKTCWFMWDVIIHPVHNFSTKPPLQSELWRLFDIFHSFDWLIHALSTLKV